MSLELHPEDRVAVDEATAHRDYILTDYEPRADPRGRLRPESLLRALLRREDLLEPGLRLIARLQEHLGRDQTVWGAKYGPAGFGLELYFYNFSDNATDHPKRVSSLQTALASELRFGSAMEESKPYFMCSFEVTAESLARGDGGHFRIYTRTGDSARKEAGFSYRVEEDGFHLENHYWFYRAAERDELLDAVARVANSPRSGGKSAWSTLLPKYLRDCFTLCYAVKPRHDGLYYSRIDGRQLGRFLAAHGHAPIAELLQRHEDDFASVLWDLGFDFAAAPSATSMSIDKLAIHGIF